MENIRFLLSALEYPEIDSFSLERSALVTLVSWLEDRKIRELEIVDRAELRKNTDQWDKAFSQYLLTVNADCLWNPEQPMEAITWLLNTMASALFKTDSSLNYQANRTCDSIGVRGNRRIVQRY